jgi:hypothetical protein
MHNLSLCSPTDHGHCINSASACSPWWYLMLSAWDSTVKLSAPPRQFDNDRKSSPNIYNPCVLHRCRSASVTINPRIWHRSPKDNRRIIVGRWSRSGYKRVTTENGGITRTKRIGDSDSGCAEFPIETNNSPCYIYIHLYLHCSLSLLCISTAQYI